MFEVGEFVKIKEKYHSLGNKYRFKITEVKEAINPASINVYKIMRDKQCSLDPVYGPYDYQLKKIYEIEDRIWREDELEPWYGVATNKIYIDDAIDSLAYATSNVTLDSAGITLTMQLPDEQDLRLLRTSLSVDKPFNIKEENEMKILRLYKERKSFEINNNYNKELQKIQNEDTIQKILLEMQEQINTILESEGRAEKLDIGSANKELLTTESKEKISKLEVETDKKTDELHASLEEIQALFELTEDFQERMKILKKYGIIDKDGKVNI